MLYPGSSTNLIVPWSARQTLKMQGEKGKGVEEVTEKWVAVLKEVKMLSEITGAEFDSYGNGSTC